MTEWNLSRDKIDELIRMFNEGYKWTRITRELNRQRPYLQAILAENGITKRPYER